MFIPLWHSVAQYPNISTHFLLAAFPYNFVKQIERREVVERNASTVRNLGVFYGVVISEQLVQPNTWELYRQSRVVCKVLFPDGPKNH